MNHAILATHETEVCAPMALIAFEDVVLEGCFPVSSLGILAQNKVRTHSESDDDSGLTNLFLGR